MPGEDARDRARPRRERRGARLRAPRHRTVAYTPGMKHIATPTIIEAAGNKPKIIEEYIGRVNSETGGVSIARMKSPSGWVEPGQTPEFDEYTLVLRGSLRVTTKGGAIDVA